ncbi:UTP--glucose-1-phosphate uridylyltransferase [Brooklawnia cerclae]|uniref:UTP--glucose-1-phosphate uridylyltransferase n=2 Tax=Brooklawnia cerclae TaxID=349934 RepID=A0ABX0SJN2_9ACTN|nr:UTP--glucose-1-phosphate uridylyltransferase [Brooklawnia cerclae]
MNAHTPEPEQADGLTRSIAKMRAAGADQVAIDVFSHYYELAKQGATGLISEDSIQPLTDPPKLDDVSVPDDAASEALGRTVIIKLNGGLGTSMGLEAAKTLLPVRDGKNFLDIIVEQVRHARRAHGARLPLLFMDSFRTRDDTLAYLERYTDLAVEGLPLDFLQNREPKLLAADLTPASWPADPDLEWCPPGHGDIYTALLGSGILDELLAKGFRYASVANGDNLGAAPNARLAGWFASTGAPYAAEVCTRTPNDRKGGHLAVRRSDGRLILRDSAQTSDEDQKYFQDETVHPYFHTNNLWFDLQQVRDAMVERKGVLGLPLIRNVKTVDPTDFSSPKVVQLETAMGAAIEAFDGARAIAVGRDRFLPVKTTNELMLLRSDVFALADDGRLLTTSAIPLIDLTSAYYKLVSDFDERVRVVPSLRQATSLVVKGDWVFDEPAQVVGDVLLPDEGETRHYR